MKELINDIKAFINMIKESGAFILPIAFTVFMLFISIIGWIFF